MLDVLWAVAAVFVLLWIFGFAFHVTAGGLVHVLLFLAIVSILARIIMGRHRTA